MTDRDTFAAAALTGLLVDSHEELSIDVGVWACVAYELADAMLRERDRTNHDAAPTARVSESPCAGHADIGGTDICDRLRACETRPLTRMADTCYGFARDGASWAELWKTLQDARMEIERLRLAIRRLADQDATLSVCNGNVTVTIDATLSDAEREAIEAGRKALIPRPTWHPNFVETVCENAENHASVLAGLLERTRIDG